MNITLRQLRAFIAVADTASFVRAAERMHVSASGLSMLVRELENQLELKVFSRSTRQVRLTDAGSEFLPLARKSLSDLEAAIAATRSLATIQRGRVTVAASVVPAATLLPWAVSDFVRAYPGIHCAVKDGFEEEIRDQVRRGEVDLGVGTLLEDDTGLDESVLYEDHLMALMPDEHPLVARGTVSWKELSQHPLIALTAASPSRHLADQAFATAGVTAVPKYEASFSSTIISMVAAGLGVAALPVNVRQVSPRVKVHARLLVRPTVKRKLGIYSRSDTELSPAAKAFRQHLESFVTQMHGIPAEVVSNAIDTS
ncbi:transcriptional regulator, LysR family [Variovorax paradoxus B4]|uniref:Transcriptional regulator, LysR family n=1 Tax=Variovorax paradoxus B4 TaxID=1246301 RepID=T1X7R0_VARPD|nr:LysR family transcriptional regulator [Variovorax paradoxus]AGU48185.1 transcriptional regulator, LysR family [Variovorax paradoxus B4]